MSTLGIDIGGTDVKAGYVTPGGELLAKFSVSVKELQKGNFNNNFVNWVRPLIKNKEIESIGIGVPGFVSKNEEFISEVLNLREIEGKTWIEKVRKAFPEQIIRLVNDANAAAIGSYFFCEEIDTDTFGFITMGTGIGSAIFLNGQIYKGENGNGPELGMIRIFNGKMVEEVIGKEGIIKISKEVAQKFQGTKLSFENIETKDLYILAKNKNPIVHEAFEKVGSLFGEAICIFIQMFDISTLYVAGGISACLPFMEEAIFKKLKSTLSKYYWDNIKIKAISLGVDIGIIGAATLCFKNQKKSL
jgi:glucokinase